MPLGLIPSRGEVRIRQFDTLSTATFIKGCAVKLGTARTLSEYSGGEASLVGVALQSSASSLPAGKVLVALPSDNAYFTADVPTTMLSSALSKGETVGLYKVGNFMSYITASYTSEAGRVAIITGDLDSANSRIEIMFNQVNTVYNSADSQVIA